MVQLLPLFLFFPDKLTDPGVHLALAQFKLHVITREKQKWKASNSMVSGPGINWAVAELISGPRSAATTVCNFRRGTQRLCVCLAGVAEEGEQCSCSVPQVCSLPSPLWGRAALCSWPTQHDRDPILLEICAFSSYSNTDNQLTDSETSAPTICLWAFSLHWISLWCVLCLIHSIPLGTFSLFMTLWFS